jgi:hypothetical protein
MHGQLPHTVLYPGLRNPLYFNATLLPFNYYTDMSYFKMIDSINLTTMGYISPSLFELLPDNGVHPVTGIKSNMKNRIMSLRDRILLRKRSVIETMNDGLKNICQVEHYLFVRMWSCATGTSSSPR